MPDIADQAQQLADLFTKLAGEVDGFRTSHYYDLTPQQRSDLEEQIQQLYDFHDQFAGDAIQNTINALQGDLTQVVNITRQATESLQHLKTIQQAVSIVSAAASFAEDIIIGDYGAIPESIRAFIQAVQPSPDKPSTAA